MVDHVVVTCSDKISKYPLQGVATTQVPSSPFDRLEEAPGPACHCHLLPRPPPSPKPRVMKDGAPSMCQAKCSSCVATVPRKRQSYIHVTGEKQVQRHAESPALTILEAGGYAPLAATLSQPESPEGRVSPPPSHVSTPQVSLGTLLFGKNLGPVFRKKEISWHFATSIAWSKSWLKSGQKERKKEKHLFTLDKSIP